MAELRTLMSLMESLSGYAEKPAILAMRQEGAERWSYTELGEHARRLARGFSETGVGHGAHVALLAGNRPEWVVACLGAIGTGAVVVPLDVRLGDSELSHALSDSRPECILTTTDQIDRLRRLDTEAAPEFILLDAEPGDERSWRRLLADSEAELPRIEPHEEAALFYTSGTTGTAKGVPLSHSNLAFQLDALLGADLVSEDDRVLLPLPLHHVYPFVVGMLAPLSAGVPIVMPRSLTGPQMVRALREGEATLIVGVPRLYEALYAGIEERSRSGGRFAAGLFGAGVSLSTRLRRRLGLRVGKLLLRPVHRRFGPELRVVASGGAALNEELALKLESFGWRVAVGYGLTETSPLLTLNPPDGRKLGSAGRPVPGVEIRIDPSAVPGEPEPQERRTDEPREEGEILALGPGVFSGYRNMPEETDEAFTEDGWFRTGDLGYFDVDGYLYVTGRASTLIVTEGGKNVQPEDVEEVYLESPVIREIGVLQKDGDLVAVIVPEPGEVRQRGDIDAAIREAVSERSKHLPSYRRISDYAITREPLEHTQLGKLRRHTLEERYERAKSDKERPQETPGPIPPEEMSEEDRALLEDPAARQVWDLLTGRYPDRRLTPDTSPQLDLDIDSLEWVNLTLEIGEKTGVELDEEAIERIETVHDLLREVAEHAEQAGTGQGTAKLSPLEHPEEVLDDRQKRLLRSLSPAELAVAKGMFALNRAVARGVFRLRVEGAENLPKEGPFVVAPNHVSYLDAFAVAAALDWRLLRQTYWGGWVGAAFGNPVSRLVSRLAQVVPVDPHRAGTSSLAFGAAVLRRGNNLIWFPEGQRSPTGELQAFRPGIGMLLDHFRVTVVPVSIYGTREAMPPGRILPHPHQITLVFGEPLDPGNLEQKGKGDQPQDRIVRALRDRMTKLGADRDRLPNGAP
jgi:long-chain acyl-CoA synthetase